MIDHRHVPSSPSHPRQETFYCSAANPDLPVVLTCTLAGHYHLAKIGFIWKYNGPLDYEIALSTNGAEWTPIITRTGMPSRVAEELEVHIHSPTGLAAAGTQRHSI